MQFILLHGTTGVWDEVACLVVPATAIMGVALAVLRQQPGQGEGAEDTGDDTDELAPPDEAAGAADGVGRG